MNSWNYIYGDYNGWGMNATIAYSSGSTKTWILTGTYGSFLVYTNASQSTMAYGYSFGVTDHSSLNLESGATIEFQIQACDGDPQFYAELGIGEGYSIVGEVSNWSSTQTITIPASSTSTNPTTTPTIPEFPLIAVPLLLSMLSVAIILRLKSKNKMRICSKYA